MTPPRNVPGEGERVDKLVQDMAEQAVAGWTTAAPGFAMERAADRLRPFAALLVRAQEVLRDLEPRADCVGAFCGGYHGDKPEECECGLNEARAHLAGKGE